MRVGGLVAASTSRAVRRGGTRKGRKSSRCGSVTVRCGPVTVGALRKSAKIR